MQPNWTKYKDGGTLKYQKGKVLKSLEELKELAEPLKRSISGETTLTKNGRRAFRVAKPSTKPAVYTKTFVAPIAAKPIELKITEIPSLKTPQEILAFDPSAYMNALTSAQNASAMGLSDLSKLLYKDASWLNPQKDAFKSKFLWGELYRDGGIIKAQPGVGKAAAKVMAKAVKGAKKPLSVAERLGIPKSLFVSEIQLGSGNYSSDFMDDAVKIAQSVMEPGKMSNEALAGVERMKKAFQSNWMHTRLKKLGYSDFEAKQYVKDRLAGLDLSKTSVAENLNSIRPLEARTSGTLIIKPGSEIGYGQNYNGLGIAPFDQQFIQITKEGKVKDIISHEVGGHGTEGFTFTHDKFGNPIYSKTELTNQGRSIANSTSLGESYYLDPSEQRARFLVTAQDMAEQDLDPNNYTDFVDFIVRNQNAPISTNLGQTARFYKFKTLWPAFSKAHAILPVGIGLGLGATQIPREKQGGSIKSIF